MVGQVWGALSHPIYRLIARTDGACNREFHIRVAGSRGYSQRIQQLIYYKIELIFL